MRDHDSAEIQRQTPRLSQKRKTAPGQGLVHLQRLAGNRAVAKLVTSPKQTSPYDLAPGPGDAPRELGPVQRHAPGTFAETGEMSAQVADEVRASEAEIAALPAATKEETKAAKKEGKEYNKSLKAAKKKGETGKAMSLAGAEKVLQAAFGSVKTIAPGAIQILAGRAALWAKYDEVCIADSLQNPDTGQPWKAGDAQVASPGLEGFAWKGVVYVNDQTPLVTATAHEMLHNNTAGGFRDAVGEVINEGSTEMLAKKALKAAGIKTPSAATAYPSQIKIVEAIADFVGESSLIDGYFKGPATLITAYETARGETGGWPSVKAAADTLDLKAVKALLKKVKKKK